MKKYYKKDLTEIRMRAFTLAEVLITLAVIGIVAAMTIPNLVQSYKKQVATVRLKKFYSMMSQALVLSEIDNGPLNSWEKNVMEDDFEQNRNLTVKYFNTYIKPYIKYTNIDENPKEGTFIERSAIEIYFADGSSMFVYNGVAFDMHFDINADKGPNVYGKDRFAFLFITDPVTLKGNNPGFYPHPGRDMSIISAGRDSVLSLCKSYAQYCGTLLKLDNWEFKDDYPYKL